MKGIKVDLKNASKVLDYLKSNGLNYDYKIKKTPSHLILPVIPNFDFKQAKKIQKISKEVEEVFEEKEKTIDFKEEAEKILTSDEIPFLKTAYDIVGNIAILEIDEILLKKAKRIAEILLKSNKNIKTVARKVGKHEGELRIQDYEVLAGEKTLLAKHKENGCVINVEINKVYYSARSATERKRVSDFIKKPEKVLVMFSGCGPFVCVIAKNTPASYVLGIELNNDGHKLALQNIQENKLSNAEAICGDVRKICPELKSKGITFDRIMMPLPKTAEEFLPEAFMVSKKGTVIHLYDFVDEKVFPDSTIQKIKDYTQKYSPAMKFKILDSVKCGQFSPSIFRVCVDFQITKI